MEIPTYITLDYPAGVATPSIQESLGRIAAALERLTQLENFVAQTLTLTPLNNPQNLNLNLNSLNSSEDSEIKITSGDGMQGKGGTPSRPRRSGFGAGRRLLPSAW